MDGRFFLYIVVSKSSVFVELFACEDETLLVGWDSFSVLDFGFDILNAVTWLNFQCDVLSCEGFDEDLHEFFILVKLVLILKAIISF